MVCDVSLGGLSVHHLLDFQGQVQELIKCQKRLVEGSSGYFVSQACHSPSGACL